MDIINKCRVDYSYRLSSTSPIITKTIISNMVSTQIIRDRLKIDKFVNKEKASNLDLLNYTIFIYNVSEEDINNVFFKDNIPKGTFLLANSLEINDVKKRCINPEEGFYLENIKVRDKLKLSFKVIILKPCICSDLTNQSFIEYDYIYNIEKSPMRICRGSNKVVTKCENNIFKQIIVNSSTKVCSSIDYVSNIKCKAEVINTKLINSHQSDFCELLVLGKLKYEISFITKGNRKCIEDVIGFSECVSVPKGAIFLDKINIKVNIEDIYIKVLNKKKIFISNILFLYY